jgi:hypothetical protein
MTLIECMIIMLLLCSLEPHPTPGCQVWLCIQTFWPHCGACRSASELREEPSVLGTASASVLTRFRDHPIQAGAVAKAVLVYAPDLSLARTMHTHVDARSHNAHSSPLMSTVPCFPCPACAGIIKRVSSVGSATWSLSRLTRFLSSTMDPSARSAHPSVRSAGNQSQHTTSSSRANTSVRGSSLDLLALCAHSLHAVAYFHFCAQMRSAGSKETWPRMHSQEPKNMNVNVVCADTSHRVSPWSLNQWRGSVRGVTVRCVC